MIEADRSSLKRPLALPSSAAEPPSRRIRRDLVSVTELETLKAELEHERSLRRIQERKHEQDKQRLQKQIEFAVDEANGAKAMLEELQETSEQHMERLRQARDNAIADLRECQADLNEAESENALALVDREENEQIRQLKSLLKSRIAENENLYDEIENLKTQLRGKDAKRKEEQAVEMPKPMQETLSPARPSILKELNRVRIELADEQRSNRQLQRKLQEMDSLSSSLIVERETASAAKSRAMQLEEDLRRMNKANEQLAAQNENWREFGKNLGKTLGIEQSERNTAPEVSTIPRILSNSKADVVEALEARNHAKSELDVAKRRIKELESTLTQARKQVDEVSQSKKAADEKVGRLELELSSLKAEEGVWKRETDSLRSLLQTFDKLPLDTSSVGGVKRVNNHVAEDKALEIQLKAEEEKVRVLQQLNDKLKTELEATSQEKEKILGKFQKIREAIHVEREKAEQADERARQAEALAGKGAFNPDETRVLHFQGSPLTQALKEEIAVLRRQIQALSEGKTKKVPTPGSEVDPEKYHQRLKQSFKEQIALFREAVYLLTGYKIDMIPSGGRTMFKVRSLFAEREEDHLMFKWPDSNEVKSLDLLTTDLAKMLMTTPSHEYITRFQSMPAFLASVQLSLFEKQTIMM